MAKNLLRIFSQLSIHSKFSTPSQYLQTLRISRHSIFTTSKLFGLEDFFEDKSNWGASEIKSGRSWTKDDMRIKSNEDLHKLWYVLLKERNMLLTMEEEAKKQIEVFPSPERLDKVEASMKNLEDVVRERNKAYHMLETGKNGERPVQDIINGFGLRTFKKLHEFPIPKHMNKKYNNFEFKENDKVVQNFLLKYREKKYLDKRRKKVRDFNHVIGLMNRFPNMDMEALKEQYPDVDIEKAKRSRKYKGLG